MILKEWKTYAEQAIGAMNELVSRYSLLVKRIAHHLMSYLPPSVQTEDLIQAGMIGLIEAAKNYDASKGASFETYAGIRIRGSMLDEIRKGDWSPRSVHRNTRKIAAAVRHVENKIGRDPRHHEVAEHLQVDLKTYHQMMQDTSNTRIFAFEDLGVKEDMLGEYLLDSVPTPLEGLQKADFQKKLTHLIAKLPEREKLILSLYYDEELTLKEVGKVLGISESRVSQVHNQAMGRLQQICLKEAY